MSRRGFRGSKWDPDIITRGQVLPEGFAHTLQRMHATRDRRLNCVLRQAHEEGWTATAMGNALGLTRERVLQRAAGGTGEVWGVDIPPPPRKVPRPAPPKVEPAVLPAAIMDELRSLQALARQVNGATVSDDPRRAASVKLSSLLAELIFEGWTIKGLSRVLGITHAAVRFRLARHGYLKPSPSAADAAYLGRPSPGVGRPLDICPEGHTIADDFYPTAHGHPRCGPCHRAASRARYRGSTAVQPVRSAQN